MTRPHPKSRRVPDDPPPELSYRAVTLPSGTLLPIEVRLGRRLLRTLPPDSDEGRLLLSEGLVDIVPSQAPFSDSWPAIPAPEIEH